MFTHSYGAKPVRKLLNEFGDCELDTLKTEFAELNPKTLNNVFSVFNTRMAMAKKAGRIKSCTNTSSRLPRR